MSDPLRPERPLAGLRVIDLSRVLAGPAAGRVFADLGADVIKVEPPSGDLSRQISPRSDRGMSALHALGNAGKRNLSLDLTRPGAREVVIDLYGVADLVIENFRPGVADRLGIGWEALSRRRPSAVLLSLNGFGSQSSLRERGAYAPMMHAITGVLQYEADWTGLPVAQMADNKADMSAGLQGAIGALAALYAARETGRGQHVEVPMFDALLASYSETGYALLPEPTHREECRLFDAGRHGAIAVAGTPQNAWMRFRDEIGLDDPAPAGADLETKARLRHGAMERWMAERADLATLLDRLEAAGLAVGRVERLEDVLRGPLAKERGLLVETEDGRGGRRPIVRGPWWFSGRTCGIERPPARRGEHNEEVLRDVLGYAASRIDALRRSGAISDESSPASDPETG